MVSKITCGARGVVVRGGRRLGVDGHVDLRLLLERYGLIELQDAVSFVDALGRDRLGSDLSGYGPAAACPGGELGYSDWPAATSEGSTTVTPG